MRLSFLLNKLNLKQLDTHNFYKIRYWSFYLFMMLLSAVFNAPVAAQQFDKDYLKWKAQQEEQDRKLSARTGQSHSNYYLSRPAVPGASGNSTTGNSSKVRLNSATVAELQQLKGVGEKKAQTIIDYRQQHGPFQRIEDIQNVKGIGPKFLQQNRHLLAL